MSLTKKPLTSHAIGMVVLLVIQYLLGMVANLFVEFPQNANAKAMWEFARTQMSILGHVIIGIMLLLGTIALVIRAFVRNDKAWIIPSIIALAAVLAAVVTGFVFIPTQSDMYSLSMAVSFLVALLAYFWGIYRAK